MSTAYQDMLDVLEDLQESAAYWSEYDVPIGIVDRINAAITKAKDTSEMQVTSAQMQVTSGEMQATSAPLSPATLTETRSISSEMQHTSNVCNKCLGSGFLPKAMSLPEPPDVKCPNGCKPPIDWTAPEMNYLAPEDYELPPADPKFLALANRELGQQLEAAKAERDDLRARLDALTEQWEADTGRLTADLRAAIEAKSHAINEADRLRAELAAERQAREALQRMEERRFRRAQRFHARSEERGRRQ